MFKGDDSVAKQDNLTKMTESNVYKLIVILGIPTIITMLVTNIYNLVDTYFVGTLGESAQGATGILFTLQSIIQAIAFMFGHGCGAYVSKFLADKDNKSANRYATSAFFISFAMGLLLMMFGLIFLDGFCYLLGSTDTILPYARDYGMWVLISAPFLMTSLVLNNILRYEGRAIFAMIGLVTGCLLNILGDFIFITVCGMGVFGAGLSTAISQFISFIILLVLFMIYAESKLNIRNISTNVVDYLKIIRTGFPSLIRQGLNSVSSGILNNLCKPYGDGAIAAMSIVNRYSSFVMSIGLGLGQGFQPVCAFNYQVKKYDRVKRGVIFTILFGMCLVSLLALPGIVAPRSIIWLFNKEESIIDIGELALRFACIGALFLPISITANMLYQSIRKSEIASFLSMLRSGLVFIPLIFIFETNFKFLGIQLAQPVSDVIAAVISVPFIILFIIKKPNNGDKLIEKNT